MGSTQVAGTVRRRRPGRARHRHATRLGWLGALLTVLVLLLPGLPVATATPLEPAAPLATTSPSASPSESAGTPSPEPSTPAPRRPDPEGDRWVQLAVVGGGSLLGAVVMFMIIGGIIRGVNRRRFRR